MTVVSIGRRAEAVRRYLAGESAGVLARTYKVNRETIYQWYADAVIAGGGIPAPPRPRTHSRVTCVNCGHLEALHGRNKIRCLASGCRCVDWEAP
jgi:Helix-turn-helix domain